MIKLGKKDADHSNVYSDYRIVENTAESVKPREDVESVDPLYKFKRLT